MMHEADLADDRWLSVHDKTGQVDLPRVEKRIDDQGRSTSSAANILEFGLNDVAKSIPTIAELAKCPCCRDPHQSGSDIVDSIIGDVRSEAFIELFPEVNPHDSLCGCRGTLAKVEAQIEANMTEDEHRQVMPRSKYSVASRNCCCNKARAQNLVDALDAHSNTPSVFTPRVGTAQEAPPMPVPEKEDGAIEMANLMSLYAGMNPVFRPRPEAPLNNWLWRERTHVLPPL